jgi:hypothetical protein
VQKKVGGLGVNRFLLHGGGLKCSLTDLPHVGI